MLTEDAYKSTDLRWDKEDLTYRYPSGRKVASSELLKIIRKEQSVLATKLNVNLTRLINGQISLEDWQRNSAQLIKDGHVSMARLGRGGKDNTFAYHYLISGNQLRTIEYPALRRFAQDLKDGKLTEKQARARMTKYALGTKASFEKTHLTLKQDAGQYWGRRRLSLVCTNHCQPCISYAMRGWLPIAQVKPPGVDCLCGGNCCCSVETRRYPPLEELQRMSQG